MIFNQSAYYLFAFAAIGTLLSASLFIPNVDGALGVDALAVKKYASLFTSLWFISTLIGVFLRIAQILDVPLSQSFDSATITSYLTQTDLGRSYFAQLIGIAVISFAIPLIKRALPLIIFTGLALVALVIPIFQSHAASNGSHSLAIGSLVIHVAALSLWVGGLFGIVLSPKSQRITALYRFSALALWVNVELAICLHCYCKGHSDRCVRRNGICQPKESCFTR
jgi:putative copper export protein